MLANTEAIGNLLLFTDTDGEVHGFSSQAEIVITPRSIQMDLAHKDGLNSVEEAFGYNCRSVEDEESGVRYSKSDSGYSTTYYRFVPDPEGGSSRVREASTEEEWKDAKQRCKAQALATFEKTYLELAAKIPGDAVYVQVRQPFGHEVAHRQFWAMLRG